MSTVINYERKKIYNIRPWFFMTIADWPSGYHLPQVRSQVLITFIIMTPISQSVIEEIYNWTKNKVFYNILPQAWSSMPSAPPSYDEACRQQPQNFAPAPSYGQPPNYGPAPAYGQPPQFYGQPAYMPPAAGYPPVGAYQYPQVQTQQVS